jgi:hypothetical protein
MVQTKNMKTFQHFVIQNFSIHVKEKKVNPTILNHPDYLQDSQAAPSFYLVSSV